MPSWIADSGLCLLAQKTRYVARYIRLRSRALSGSFARLLGAGTARSLIQIDGSLIPKRGIGQHAVDTALALGGDLFRPLGLRPNTRRASDHGPERQAG